MAHEIFDGKMVFAGATPWHGLGTQLPENGTYDQIRDAAGFETIQDVPLMLAGMDRTIPDCRALITLDSKRYLATVGSKYEIVQSADIAKVIVDAGGGVDAIWHTAGTLGARGERGWLLGELPNPIQVRGDDSPIRKYLLGSWGHDGKTAVTLKNVAMRVVCQNTLGSALKESGAEFRIYHSKNSANRLSEAGQAFKDLAQSYDNFGQLANVLSATRMTDADMRITVDNVLPLPSDEKDHTMLESDRERVNKLFHEAIGMNDKIQNTAWAAVQAWSEFSDHHRTTRKSATQSANAMKLDSVWFGKGAKMKQDSLKAILAVCNVRANVSSTALALV